MFVKQAWLFFLMKVIRTREEWGVDKSRVIRFLFKPDVYNFRIRILNFTRRDRIQVDFKSNPKKTTVYLPRKVSSCLLCVSN